MGLSPFSACDYKKPSATHSPLPPRLPNPDPGRFFIEQIKASGAFTIVMVRYPDCTNYEGKKIMVYENVAAAEIRAAARLDPHFCPDKHISPIARFRPTQRGWRDALAFCNAASRPRRKQRKGGSR